MTTAIPTYNEFCRYLDNINFQKFLAKHKTCEEARAWVGTRTSEQAWEQCPRADWMLWLANEIVRGQELKQELVRTAADITRTALASTRDPRGHDCVAAVDRWLTGEQVDLQAAAQAQHADIVRKHIPWNRIRPLLARALQEIA